MADFAIEIQDNASVNVTPPDTAANVVLVAGPPGPQGPPGTGGYVHTQAVAAGTWTFTHTLGRFPMGCEVSISGEVVYTDVSYPDSTTVVCTFASPQAGTARLI